jgi:hypothetical protein
VVYIIGWRGAKTTRHLLVHTAKGASWLVASFLANRAEPEEHHWCSFTWPVGNRPWRIVGDDTYWYGFC